MACSPLVSVHGYEENFYGQRSTSLDLLYLQHLGSCQSAEQESEIHLVMCSLLTGHTCWLVHAAVAATPPYVLGSLLSASVQIFMNYILYPLLSMWGICH
jgi:hypothetical protein